MLAACLGDEEVVLLLVGGVGPEQQPVLQEARAGRPDEVRNGIQLMKIATKGGEGARICSTKDWVSGMYQ